MNTGKTYRRFKDAMAAHLFASQSLTQHFAFHFKQEG